ncbi:MAG: NAD(P)H-hydrate epimerase, partial [Paracoccaceae bacterium]
MTELLTAAQMRSLEQAAIDSGAVTGLELMERAGRGVVDAILEWRPELATTSHRAVVLCGPGNNGGDGFVVARLLHQRGWEVEVFLYGDEAKLPPDAAENARRWREMGTISPLSKSDFDAAHDRSLDALVEDREGNVSVLSRRTIYLDALFGTGLGRPLEDKLFEILRVGWTDDCYEYGVAIDFPSGICADCGQYIGGRAPIYVPLVVTFQQPKRGH